MPGTVLCLNVKQATEEYSRTPTSTLSFIVIYKNIQIFKHDNLVSKTPFL
jgi:hypothetical protein